MENDKEKIEEAYERFDGFEKKLMSVDNVTWKHDDEMNAEIHLAVLQDLYGEEKVENLLQSEGIDFKYLANHESFLRIADLLNK